MSDDSFTLSDDSSALHGERRPPTMPIGLRVLSHPNMDRVGDLSILFAPEASGEVELSRSTPLFCDAHGKERGALHTRHVSRVGLRLRRREDGSLLLRVQAGHSKLSVDGRACDSEQQLEPGQLREGVVLTLGRSVALWLGEVDVKNAPSLPGFVGLSPAAQRLKRELAARAALDSPLLIVGEAGVGKQLAARAVHTLSARRAEPFVAVSAALLSPRGTARTLLGQNLPPDAGVLAAAGGGTLCLIDLGALDLEAQSELQHALDWQDTRTARGGENAPGPRIVAGSDLDPDCREDAGKLRRALVDRFPQLLRIPPLRMRREDIALLFTAFLRAAMQAHDASERLTANDVDAAAFLPARLMATLVRSEWPGNVRQLRNVAEAFALANHAADETEISEWIAANMSPPAAPEQKAAVPAMPSASELSDAAIRQALQETRYNITQAAELLGVSKAWLHPRIQRSGLLPRAKDLSPELIEQALASAQFEIARAAQQLHVSKHGLLIRMHALGLKLPNKPPCAS